MRVGPPPPFKCSIHRPQSSLDLRPSRQRTHPIPTSSMSVRPLVGLDASQEDKNGLRPVRQSICVCDIEDLVYLPRQSLTEIANHIAPDLRGFEAPGLYPSDRFHVCGNSFLNPVMFLSHRGERQVGHFVCHSPIPLQIRQGCLAANRDRDKRNWRTKGSTIVNASALACSNSYRYARHRIAAKIGSDRLGGSTHPPDQICVSDGYFLANGKHIDEPARSHDRRRFATASIAAKRNNGG